MKKKGLKDDSQLSGQIIIEILRERTMTESQVRGTDIITLDLE